MIDLAFDYILLIHLDGLLNVVSYTPHPIDLYVRSFESM